ncbi:MAG: RNA-binding S4 domain-containing protein [Hyphomicrobiaceae bacterium]
MADQETKGDVSKGVSQRLDKWIWFARVIRTRTLAAGLVTDGHVRVNRARVLKPSHLVKVGDVITVAVGPHVRILEVLAAGIRRGPPLEAQALYKDLTPSRVVEAGVDAGAEATPAQREQGAGRPTKRDRRAIDRLRETDT